MSWKAYLSWKCVATRICIGGVSRCSLKLTTRCGTGSLAQSSDFFSTKYFKSLHIREVWQKKAAKLGVCHLWGNTKLQTKTGLAFVFECTHTIVPHRMQYTILNCEQHLKNQGRCSSGFNTALENIQSTVWIINEHDTIIAQCYMQAKTMSCLKPQ